MIRKSVKRITKKEKERSTMWTIVYVRVRWTFLGIPFYAKYEEVGRQRSLFQ